MTMTFGRMAGFAAMAAMARDTFAYNSGGIEIGRTPIKRAAVKPNPPGSRAKRGKKPKALRFR